MNNLISLLHKAPVVTVLLIAARFLCGCQKKNEMKIKVASYNIQSFRTMDFTFAPQKTMAAAKSFDADLIGFQEVRHNDSDTSDFFADLGKLCGGKTFFAQTLRQNDFNYGIGSFSRFPARVVKEIWLPGRKNLEPRKALFLEVTAEDKKFYFITTHLSFEDSTGALQRQQLEVILTTAEQEKFLPAILTGDLNANPDSPAIRLLKSKWSITGDTPQTFPADKPNRRLDYIAVSDPAKIRLISTRVIDDSTTSDHRPVIAEFELTL